MSYTTPMKDSLALRFWAKVEKTDTCWLWTGTTHHGYGAIKVGNTMRKAHRIALDFASRPVSEGYEVDHLCRNRSCVRPDHLDIVTRQENNRRRRRATCGRGHPLTGDNVYVRMPRGERVCRACQRILNAAYRRRKGLSEAVYQTDAGCVHGHPWTPENTRLEGTRRVCRACARERMRDAYRSNPEPFKERSRVAYEKRRAA